MKLEAGKTYICRDGVSTITVLDIDTGYAGQWRVIGRDQLGRATWRHASGRFDRYPHALDAVRELETANVD